MSRHSINYLAFFERNMCVKTETSFLNYKHQLEKEKKNKRGYSSSKVRVHGQKQIVESKSKGKTRGRGKNLKGKRNRGAGEREEEEEEERRRLMSFFENNFGTRSAWSHSAPRPSSMLDEPVQT